MQVKGLTQIAGVETYGNLDGFLFHTRPAPYSY